jgi:hypothetical protein
VFAACTIVAKNYLSFARVLAHSFRAHHPDLPFFVLLADEVDGYFDPAQEPFQLIPFCHLDITHPERFRFHYPQQPLSYASTPYLLSHLLNRGFTRVLFFKQESLVLGDHTPIVELLADRPIVMTPHLLEPLQGPDRIARELNILQSGIFNVGLLGVSEGETTRRFLRWWEDRVYAACRHDLAYGIHYEQRWLDFAPVFFEGTHVVRDPAFNVGHWNLPERCIDVRGDDVLVNDTPCRLFRFSGYSPDAPREPTRYAGRLTWLNIGPARLVFERYCAALEREGYHETKLWPFSYGAFDNGIAIPDFARHLYARLGDEAATFGDPRETSSPRSFFAWLNAPQCGATDPAQAVTKLWHEVYRARPDLPQAFPDVLGEDRAAFLDWTAQYGVRELGISRDFVARTTA